MKNRTTKLIILIAASLMFISPLLLMNNHHRTAADYKKVLRQIKVELPNASKVESWDNYDRGASRWDCLEHLIEFETKLPGKTVEKLEKLCATNRHWYKHDDGKRIYYEYRSEREWNSDLYFLSCRIQEDQAMIEYYIDEDEGLFVIVIYILLIFLVIAVFVLWAIVRMIKNLLARKVRKDDYIS